MDEYPKNTNPLSDVISLAVKAPEKENWQALLVFSIFRCCLAATFLGFILFDIGPAYIGYLNPSMFLITNCVYMTLSLVWLYTVLLKKVDYDLQVNLPIFFDIIALILMMHLSGGVLSGLGLLIIIIVASHSLLAERLFAISGAALSSSAILAEEIYLHFSTLNFQPAYPQAGFLGFSIFVTAVIASSLRKRMDTMQQLAYSRGVKLANSLQLNAQVVTTMQEGVIALDHEGNIQLINSAAFKMLNLKKDYAYLSLQELPIRFQQAFKSWQKNQNDEIFQVSKHTSEIRLSAVYLTSEPGLISGQVIFIHDVTKESQKAQYMKLAILGNLAANIAHEIRNPLSSVSHAAQLLNESHRSTNSEEQHLIQIIQDNCDRMNTVIKNVLNISKKQTANPQIIELNQFLKDFTREFKPAHLPNINIQFQPLQLPLSVLIDASQLRQMLINLGENGLRYSLAHLGEPRLDIVLETEEDPARVHIHIQDYGVGIDGRDAKHMFEPFYTTEKNGSGLGLYLTREICQINGGEIHYYPKETGGSDFCITLPLYQEMQYYA